jgi:hypothetical protein
MRIAPRMKNISTIGGSADRVLGVDLVVAVRRGRGSTDSLPDMNLIPSLGGS